ncbi:unnamed protein product, partial [Musa hybrid cultivar]
GVAVTGENHLFAGDGRLQTFFLSPPVSPLQLHLHGRFGTLRRHRCHLLHLQPHPLLRRVHVHAHVPPKQPPRRRVRPRRHLPRRRHHACQGDHIVHQELEQAEGLRRRHVRVRVHRGLLGGVQGGGAEPPRLHRCSSERVFRYGQRAGVGSHDEFRRVRERVRGEAGPAVAIDGEERLLFQALQQLHCHHQPPCLRSLCNRANFHLYYYFML